MAEAHPLPWPLAWGSPPPSLSRLAHHFFCTLGPISSLDSLGGMEGGRRGQKCLWKRGQTCLKAWTPPSGCLENLYIPARTSMGAGARCWPLCTPSPSWPGPEHRAGGGKKVNLLLFVPFLRLLLCVSVSFSVCLSFSCPSLCVPACIFLGLSGLHFCRARGSQVLRFGLRSLFYAEPVA